MADRCNDVAEASFKVTAPGPFLLPVEIAWVRFFWVPTSSNLQVSFRVYTLLSLILANEPCQPKGSQYVHF